MTVEKLSNRIMMILSVLFSFLPFMTGCTTLQEKIIELQSEKVYEISLPLVVDVETDLVEKNNIGQGLSGIKFTYIKENIPRVQQKTWENLVRNNENEVLLPASFFEKTNYQFVSWDDLPKSSEFSLNYHEIQKTYPRAVGLIGISRIGFNNTMTQSLILVDSSSIIEPLWGSGYLILCEKRFGFWVVVQQYKLYDH